MESSSDAYLELIETNDELKSTKKNVIRLT